MAETETELAVRRSVSCFACRVLTPGHSSLPARGGRTTDWSPDKAVASLFLQAPGEAVDVERLRQLIGDDEAGSEVVMSPSVANGAAEVDVSEVTSAVNDIDCFISNLKQWQQQHETEVKDLMARNQQALEAVEEATSRAAAAGADFHSDLVAEARKQGASVAESAAERLQRVKEMAAAPRAAAAAGSRRLTDKQLEMLKASGGEGHGFLGKGASAASAAGAGCGDAAAATTAAAFVPRGQQLLDELEAELLELDNQTSDVDKAVEWYQDLERVMTRMETLTSGYQAAAPGAAGALSSGPTAALLAAAVQQPITTQDVKDEEY